MKLVISSHHLYLNRRSNHSNQTFNLGYRFKNTHGAISTNHGCPFATHPPTNTSALHFMRPLGSFSFSYRFKTIISAVFDPREMRRSGMHSSTILQFPHTTKRNISFNDYNVFFFFSRERKWKCWHRCLCHFIFRFVSELM